MKRILLSILILGFCSINHVLQAQDEEFEQIFSVVETMPSFPGCGAIEDSTEKVRCTEKELLKHCYMNIRYPNEARVNNIQGFVVVQFVVTKEGTVEDAVILRGIGGGCDEELLRVVNLMNELEEKWTPGTQNGKSVNVRYNLPIRFKLAQSNSSSVPNKKRRKKRDRD